MNENTPEKKDPFGTSPMSQVYGSSDALKEKETSQVLQTRKVDAQNRYQGKKDPQHSNFFWELVKIVVVAALIVLPVRYFLFQPFIVKGDSMVPNFHSGDYLIVDEFSYRLNSPERGDVVVLKYPLDTSQRFIKRIIGLPGETVEIKNGKVIVLKDGNNTPLDEKKYLPSLSATDGNVTVTLGAGKYFVLGDNRQFSYDSRRWGVLPREDIIGKAFFRVFPISTMSYVASPSYPDNF